ncbi:uncharacterized protein MONOS_17137 [Monocercomonoides exilis]|uniref:uncharacterized protein n=1 Tax=Monocercomonoides exilis TaxID=2049356 RepID=UPI0035593BDC|nr:hypothetical protein MONOS_17137 [Monocercomonoides exilis]
MLKMRIFVDNTVGEKILETDNRNKFTKLFCELEHFSTDEQRQKIEEMNELMEEMGKEEFKSVFTKEWFNEMDKIIEEKILSWENAILLLKHVGYYNAVKCIYDHAFSESFLSDRFQKMIIEEEEKKEEKNESLLVDLCECFSLLYFYFISDELISICVHCLLKIASKKEENEEVQKKVEIALLALSGICGDDPIEQELYLNEIKEIIKYQQKHRNLTHLAYQSAWSFLFPQLFYDDSLEDTIMSELHFGREAARELEELTKCVNWKKKEKEMSKEEAKEELALMRWLETLGFIFFNCQLRNEEITKLIGCIVQVFRAAKDNHKEISDKCIYSLRNSTENRFVKVEDLLKGGAVDAVLEEFHQQTLNKDLEYECFQFFTNVSNRLKEEEKDEKEEAKRKATKMEIFEKLEEEGFEDIVISIHDIFNNRNRQIFTLLIMIVLHLILKA